MLPLQGLADSSSFPYTVARAQEPHSALYCISAHLCPSQVQKPHPRGQRRFHIWCLCIELLGGIVLVEYTTSDHCDPTLRLSAQRSSNPDWGMTTVVLVTCTVPAFE